MKKEDLIEKIFEKIDKEEKLLKIYRSFPNAVSGDTKSPKETDIGFSEARNISRFSILQQEKKISKLYKLLDKVNSSGFGICRICGKSILTGNFETEESHDLCVDCARE